MEKIDNIENKTDTTEPAAHAESIDGAAQAKTGPRVLGMSVSRFLLLILSGLLIGGGAILPGISGGVLCVVFGIYRPMMEVLAHPVRSLPQHWRILLPVCIGFLAGFLGFARVIEWIFSANEMLGTWLFIGLIAGTVPALFKEASAQGRPRGSWLSCILAFALLFGVLLFFRMGKLGSVSPSVPWFLFCGVLWGASLVVPGMTSSSVLLSLGLYEPLAKGIAELDFTVVGPWLIGLVATIGLLSRLVNHLFHKYYALAYHAVVGVVLASTLIIIPTPQYTVGTALLSALCFAVGFAAAWLMARFSPPESMAA